MADSCPIGVGTSVAGSPSSNQSKGWRRYFHSISGCTARVRSMNIWGSGGARKDAVGKVLVERVVVGQLRDLIPGQGLPSAAGSSVRIGSIATRNCSALCPSGTCTSRR
jgi:hypothetical protein